MCERLRCKDAGWLEKLWRDAYLDVVAKLLVGCFCVSKWKQKSGRRAFFAEPYLRHQRFEFCSFSIHVLKILWLSRFLGIYSMGFVSNMCLNAIQMRVLFSLFYLKSRAGARFGTSETFYELDRLRSRSDEHGIVNTRTTWYCSNTVPVRRL
jgi:hypothetical protein